LYKLTFVVGAAACKAKRIFTSALFPRDLEMQE
jgi:hypothetical protein